MQRYFKEKNASWKDFGQKAFTNPNYLIIIAANLSIFLLPNLNLKENAITFIWIYMVQSLLIGLFHFVKLNVYRFAPATRSKDWKNPHAISLFFLVHYGFFHFVYFFFLPPAGVHWDVVLQGSAIFGSMLIVNTIRHFSQENSGKYNANDFMFLPYVRILPIHMAIILGGFISIVTSGFIGVFVVLAIIKTLLELFLEYLQQLGVSFSDINKLGKDDAAQ